MKIMDKRNQILVKFKGLRNKKINKNLPQKHQKRHKIYRLKKGLKS